MANGRRRRRFFVWWPKEGEGKGSLLGGQRKEKEKVICLVANGRRKRRFFSTSSHFPPSEKEKVLFHLFSLSPQREREGSFPPLLTFPQATLLKPSFFSFDIKVLLYHGFRPLFTHSLPFPRPINYDRVFLMSQVPHTFITDLIWLKISYLFLEIMALCMATSYGPQAAQMNEEPASKSSLDLTLMQHPCEEDPTLREMHVRLEVNPPRAWYYRIFSNSHTLVILLQVDLTSGDEPKTVCDGCHKTKDTSIFAWSSVLDVGHYRVGCAV